MNSQSSRLPHALVGVVGSLVQCLFLFAPHRSGSPAVLLVSSHLYCSGDSHVACAQHVVCLCVGMGLLGLSHQLLQHLHDLSVAGSSDGTGGARETWAEVPIVVPFRFVTCGGLGAGDPGAVVEIGRGGWYSHCCLYYSPAAGTPT